MKSPFVFSRIVTGEKFVGRNHELKKLSNNYRDGINTFIISPRRTGKSSLVFESVDLFKRKEQEDSKVQFVFVNLWNVRSEEEFYEMFANQLLKATSNKFTEVIEAAKSFLGNLRPSLKLEYEAIRFEVDVHQQKEDLGLVLDLPQKLAQKKKSKIVVCLDEFQDIEYFKDSLSFQKSLRSHWQNHADVSYILYGSKRHMMSNLFNNESMPFFRFGDVLYLKKIETSKWIDFIVNSFQTTKKKIDKENAEYITQILDCHPYYIQQFCNILWQNTTGRVSRSLVEESLLEFLEYNSGQFEIIIKNLSSTQLNFLKALCQKETGLHSQAVLAKYKLGSSANVTSIKRALVEKELIEVVEDGYSIADPVLEIYINELYKNRFSD